MYYLLLAFSRVVLSNTYQKSRCAFSPENPKYFFCFLFVEEKIADLRKKTVLKTWNLKKKEGLSDLVCQKSLGYWLTPAAWPHMTLDEGRGYKWSFVCLHSVQMRGLAVQSHWGRQHTWTEFDITVAPKLRPPGSLLNRQLKHFSRHPRVFTLKHKIKPEKTD